MTRPLPPTEDLDEQERQLARIVRALPGGEPPAALDARILKSAANAAASSRGPRARWLASSRSLWGIGGAAAAVLALGVSWQLMHASPRPQPAATRAAQAEDDSVAVGFKDAQPQTASNAPVAAEPAVAPAPPSLAKPAPAPGRVASAGVPAAAPGAPVPEAFPGQDLDQQVASRAERAESARSAESGPSAQAPAAAAAQASARSANAAKVMAGVAQESAAGEAQAAGALSDAAPTTALAAGPMPPATWLAHIRQLRDQQRSGEARASLLEFQRRYPDVVVPPDLAPLLRQ